jgi:hypothetical protein
VSFTSVAALQNGFSVSCPSTVSRRPDKGEDKNSIDLNPRLVKNGNVARAPAAARALILQFAELVLHFSSAHPSANASNVRPALEIRQPAKAKDD